MITTSWKFIKFPKKTPGKIFNNKITGHVEEKVEISQIDIIDITKNVKGIYEIRTKDGRTYPEPGTIIDTYVFYKGKDNKIVISYLKSMSIPLSEVKYIKVKRIDYRLTFLAVSLPIGLVILARALGRTMEFAY